MVRRSVSAISTLPKPGECDAKRHLVVDPAVARAFQRHEVLDARQSVSNAVDGLDVVGVSADDLRAAVVDDVLEVIREQPIIDRHQYRADLRDRIIRLQMGVRVRGDVGHPIALSDSEGLQRRRPAIAAFQELCVGQSQIPIDDRFALGVEPACASSELHGGQGNFHNATFLQCADGRGVSATSDNCVIHVSSTRANYPAPARISPQGGLYVNPLGGYLPILVFCNG